MPISILYIIQTASRTQSNSQSDSSPHPEHVLFMERMFLTHRSTKNTPTPISTQTHVRNIDNAATFITKLSKKFGIMKPSMWMIYTMVQFITISYLGGRCVLIWQPNKIFRDLRNSKRSRELSATSMEILVSGTDHKCCWTLCLHTVYLGTWTRYEIQQCHCFIPALAHTACRDNQHI